MFRAVVLLFMLFIVIDASYIDKLLMQLTDKMMTESVSVVSVNNAVYRKRIGWIALCLRVYHLSQRQFDVIPPLPVSEDEYANSSAYRICTNGVASMLDCIDALNMELRQYYFRPYSTESTSRGEYRIAVNVNNYNADSYLLTVFASYIMCWLTMNEYAPLKFLPFCDIPDKVASIEVKYLTTGDAMNVIDEQKQKAFDCARRSFCPDNCRINNACSKLKGMGECKLISWFNSDLSGIITNQWNTTCTCSLASGLAIFDPQQKMCIDFDECVMPPRKFCPANARCVNTLGSAICVCDFGYEGADCTPILIDLKPTIGWYAVPSAISTATPHHQYPMPVAQLFMMMIVLVLIKGAFLYPQV